MSSSTHKNQGLDQIMGSLLEICKVLGVMFEILCYAAKSIFMGRGHPDFPKFLKVAPERT